MSIEVLGTKTVVIMCPGFLDYPHSDGFIHVQETLNRFGIASYTLDPCGLWISGGEIQTYTIIGYTEYVNNQLRLVKFMYPEVEHIVLLGHSLGAYIALKVAETNADVHMVVAVASPHESDLVALANKWHKGEAKRSIRANPNTKQAVVFDVPFSFAQELYALASSSVQPIKGCGYLFVDPVKDEVLSANSVRKLVDRFAEESVCSLLQLANQDHHITVDFPRGWESIIREMIRLLEKM